MPGIKEALDRNSVALGNTAVAVADLTALFMKERRRRRVQVCLLALALTISMTVVGLQIQQRHDNERAAARQHRREAVARCETTRIARIGFRQVIGTLLDVLATQPDAANPEVQAQLAKIRTDITAKFDQTAPITEDCATAS